MNGKGIVIVQHGSLAIIGQTKVRFGTVAGYEEQSLRQYTKHTAGRAEAASLPVEVYIAQQVAEAVRRARRLTHELRWISLEPVILVNDRSYYEEQRRLWEPAPRLTIGDAVVLDGDVYRIEAAPNGNFKLVLDEGDEPSRYRPEKAVLYNGTPGSGSSPRSTRKAGER